MCGKYFAYRRPFRFHWIIYPIRQWKYLSLRYIAKKITTNYANCRNGAQWVFTIKKEGTYRIERKVVNLSFRLTIMMIAPSSIFRSHSRLRMIQLPCDAITSGNVQVFSCWSAVISSALFLNGVSNLMRASCFSFCFVSFFFVLMRSFTFSENKKLKCVQLTLEREHK